MTDPPSRSTMELAAGVVAYNDEAHLERAVRSLLDQSLPGGVRWTGLWLVVSPSSDRTVAVAHRLAAQDGRIQLLVEPERRGKSAALAEVLAQARGDAIVLLNGDAEAGAGSVARLLEAVPSTDLPYAVMARPVPAATPGRPLDRVIELLWAVHHRFHAEILRSSLGTHLSDELMLVSLRAPVPLREGIVNDGAFLASWLRSVGGPLRYAEHAVVRVTTPGDLSELLGQRARIQLGHRQVARLTGIRPTTLPGWWLRRPAPTLRLLWRSISDRRAGLRLLASLMIIDALAAAWALSRVAVGRAEPIRWPRYAGRSWDGGAVGRHDDAVS